MDTEHNLRNVEPAGAPTLLGWRLLVSEKVMKTCVKVPQGVEGQTTAGRSGESSVLRNCFDTLGSV